MLPASKEQILARLGADARVLDVGGWAKPFPRADWVVDLMPYATRGLYGSEDDAPERFTEQTWVEMDICGPEPLPFADRQFDFVVCSHTLEDVRDPIRVCAEIVRVGRAGYVEVPSRLEEQSEGFHGPFTGWTHHRWLVDAVEEGLELVFKHGVLQGGDPAYRFPPGFQQRLTPAERVITLWWEGSFACRERVIIDPEELRAYLADYVQWGLREHPLPRPQRRPGLRRLARALRGT